MSQSYQILLILRRRARWGSRSWCLYSGGTKRQFGSLSQRHLSFCCPVQERVLGKPQLLRVLRRHQTWHIVSEAPDICPVQESALGKPELVLVQDGTKHGSCLRGIPSFHVLRRRAC